MSRVPPLTEAEAAPAARALLEQQRAAHGRTTNMKRTLAHSPTALRALMAWYDLHPDAVDFLGPRPTTLFVHPAPAQAACLVCSTFFRRWLIDAGDDPDALRLDERERALVDYGRQLARDANGVSDVLFEKLQRFLTPAQVVTLTA